MGKIGTYDPDKDATYCKLCKRWLRGKPAWGYRSHTKNPEHREKLQAYLEKQKHKGVKKP